MKTSTSVLVLAVAALALSASPARAQNRNSIGAGVALPQGDYADFVDTGFTLRLQSATSYDHSEVQLQAGWTRFGGKEIDGGGETDTADVFHVTFGVRIGATIFVGANGGYFWGDTDDGWGFLPEAGLRFGPVELVGDYRADGEEKWFGIRAAVAFGGR